MGWFKSILKAIDPLRPEWEKNLSSKIDSALGNTGEYATVLPAESTTTDTTADTTTASTGAITEEEAQAVAQKRLARLGKYFTSPLGVLGNASTAAQKVFS